MDSPNRLPRAYLAILAVAGTVALVGAAFAAALAGTSAAAPSQAPVNTAEPAITGVAEEGRTLTVSDGTWTGTTPLTFTYRWLRCPADGGLPDASNCEAIAGAASSTYVLARADVGFRIRARVTASNSDGSATALANGTAVVVGPPVNTEAPVPTGTMVVGQTVTASPGTWVGRQPIAFAHSWLRCNSAGSNCTVIAGATNATYQLAQSDAGSTVRFDLTASNAVGSTTVRSTPSTVVLLPTPSDAIRLPNGETSITARSVPTNARLVVAEVRFSPNPVRSRVAPISVRIRVKDTRGFVIRDAFVFVRSTPRVTSGGDRQRTAQDGWVTYQLVPNARFPQPRRGFNVQFFVKAYRDGDPPLAGVAAYRLVQVRLAR